MSKVLLILVSGALVNNVVLSRFLGLCSFVGVSKKTDTSTGMGGAVIFVIFLATILASVVYACVLKPFGIDYLQTIVFILLIASLVQFIEMFMKKSMPGLHAALGIFLPLITTNCVVLGVAIQVVTNEYDFGAGVHMMGLGQAVLFAIASAIGYGIALILFAGIREQLELSNVPKVFKGVPIALLTAGIMALAFMGFSGLV